MYLVLSALTSSPISLVAATKASAFSFRVRILLHALVYNFQFPNGQEINPEYYYKDWRR